MRAVDLAILIAYLAGTVALGAWFSRSHRDVKGYFVTRGDVPWWAIMSSIVATETSAATFISVPGIAYGGNFSFLQLVIGYLIGRLVVSALFVPLYFRGELLTVYQVLGQRFGGLVKRLAASLFLITRSLADGFRLYLTGLVLSALLLALPGTDATARAIAPGFDPTFTIIIVSVLVIGVATILYTYLGGMEAVIWTDVTQLGIYLLGAFVAAIILLDRLPGGWGEVAAVGSAAGKFQVFDPTWDVTRSYTLWSGIIGGAFLTTATHGTDQLMVQRYLCGTSARHARLALLTSGVVVFFQFVLFLLIGAMLYVFYTAHAPQEVAAFTVDGRIQGDRIFPHFIVTHLPTGIVGLVVAAIAAAAFTSSLNAQAATTMADFYMPMTGGRRPEAHYLRVSKVLTAGWGLVQIAVGCAAIKLSQSVVNEVLGIASFTNGVILGVFFLGTLTTRVRQRAAVVGMATGAAVVLAVRLFTAVSWQWYVLIGSVVTLSIGYLASFILSERE